jgi:hypothetical protein
MARVGQRQVQEGDARVNLGAAPGDDADVVPGVGHQAGMLAEHTFYSPDHWRRGVMEQADIHFTACS